MENIDFCDFNKACPKDCYPFPRIDQLVNFIVECELIYMLDAYQGYHQIHLAKADQDKVSFVISFVTFYYTVISFGLKNAVTTYQRLMDKVSKKQLERNIEIYVDDILIKSVKFEDLVATLEVTFVTLCRPCLKLNPNKCIFSVRSERFLGYLITKRGIEADPKKVPSLQYTLSPKNITKVQRLVGRITTLSLQVSRSKPPLFQDT